MHLHGLKLLTVVFITLAQILITVSLGDSSSKTYFKEVADFDDIIEEREAKVEQRHFTRSINNGTMASEPFGNYYIQPQSRVKTDITSVENEEQIEPNIIVKNQDKIFDKSRRSSDLNLFNKPDLYVIRKIPQSQKYFIFGDKMENNNEYSNIADRNKVVTSSDYNYNRREAWNNNSPYVQLNANAVEYQTENSQENPVIEEQLQCNGLFQLFHEVPVVNNMLKDIVNARSTKDLNNTWRSIQCVIRQHPNYSNKNFIDTPESKDCFQKFVRNQRRRRHSTYINLRNKRKRINNPVAKRNVENDPRFKNIIDFIIKNKIFAEKYTYVPILFTKVVNTDSDINSTTQLSVPQITGDSNLQSSTLVDSNTQSPAISSNGTTDIQNVPSSVTQSNISSITSNTNIQTSSVITDKSNQITTPLNPSTITLANMSDIIQFIFSDMPRVVKEPYFISTLTSTPNHDKISTQSKFTSLQLKREYAHIQTYQTSKHAKREDVRTPSSMAAGNISSENSTLPSGSTIPTTLLQSSLFPVTISTNPIATPIIVMGRRNISEDFSFHLPDTKRTLNLSNSLQNIDPIKRLKKDTQVIKRDMNLTNINDSSMNSTNINDSSPPLIINGTRNLTEEISFKIPNFKRVIRQNSDTNQYSLNEEYEEEDEDEDELPNIQLIMRLKKDINSSTTTFEEPIKLQLTDNFGINNTTLFSKTKEVQETSDFPITENNGLQDNFDFEACNGTTTEEIQISQPTYNTTKSNNNSSDINNVSNNNNTNNVTNGNNNNISLSTNGITSSTSFDTLITNGITSSTSFDTHNVNNITNVITTSISSIQTDTNNVTNTITSSMSPIQNNTNNVTNNITSSLSPIQNDTNNVTNSINSMSPVKNDSNTLTEEKNISNNMVGAAKNENNNITFTRTNVSSNNNSIPIQLNLTPSASTLLLTNVSELSSTVASTSNSMEPLTISTSGNFTFLNDTIKGPINRNFTPSSNDTTGDLIIGSTTISNDIKIDYTNGSLTLSVNNIVGTSSTETLQVFNNYPPFLTSINGTMGSLTTDQFSLTNQSSNSSPLTSQENVEQVTISAHMIPGILIYPHSTSSTTDISKFKRNIIDDIDSDIADIDTNNQIKEINNNIESITIEDPLLDINRKYIDFNPVFKMKKEISSTSCGESQEQIQRCNNETNAILDTLKALNLIPEDLSTNTVHTETTSRTTSEEEKISTATGFIIPNFNMNFNLNGPTAAFIDKPNATDNVPLGIQINSNLGDLNQSTFMGIVTLNPLGDLQSTTSTLPNITDDNKQNTDLKLIQNTTSSNLSITNASPSTVQTSNPIITTENISSVNLLTSNTSGATENISSVNLLTSNTSGAVSSTMPGTLVTTISTSSLNTDIDNKLEKLQRDLKLVNEVQAIIDGMYRMKHKLRKRAVYNNQVSTLQNYKVPLKSNLTPSPGKLKEISGLGKILKWKYLREQHRRKRRLKNRRQRRKHRKYNANRHRRFLGLRMQNFS